MEARVFLGVCQKKIGQYPTSVEFGAANSFEAMGISQSDLDFTVTFTAEVTTYSEIYTLDYEITIMPSGYDATKMEKNYFDAYNYVKTFDKGIPFIIVD